MRVKDWRLKVTAQRAFSAVPGGHHLNYLFQRSLGGLPLSEPSLAVEIPKGIGHRDALRSLGIDLATAQSFEFGAGYDLHLPLIQAALGVDRQTVVDIRRVARATLVADIAGRLAAMAAPTEPWTPGVVASGSTMADVLKANRITYLAPADARATSLATGSVDAVITTSTLEHIPADDLRSILRECHRLLRDGGGMSMLIDYSDHWSHFDPTITAYNFLRFTAPEWDRRNPALNYQNRLRHSDYLALFDETGFDVVSADVTGADEAGLAALATVPLASPYDVHPVDDLAITTAHLALRRRAVGSAS